MKQKAIIAGWMSPMKLRKFAECNLVINLLMLEINRLLGHLSISEASYHLFENLVHWYGVAIFCLAVVLLILSRLTALSGFDKPRVISLIGLGIMNFVYALNLIWR